MEMILHKAELPLRHVFTISRGSQEVQISLIVELRDGDVSGFGEGASAGYYGATFETMREALESVRTDVEAASIEQPSLFWDRMFPSLQDNRFALCALDQAAHDLWGKCEGRPVYQLWGLSTGNCPPTDYTIGIDTIPKMIEKMREFPGWPVYKIKLGTPDDISIVEELRKHTDATFRVDANCAWATPEAIANSRALAGLGVEFIEQPLPPDDRQGMRRVYQQSKLPVIADESCIIEEDVDRCHGCFHGINIKLTKAGGMTPARRMIARGRELGMKVMVGCMTESTVGISAIAQLLPLLDYVDMDGALLLAEDAAEGVSIEQGRVVYPTTPGNGVRLLPELKS